MRKNIFYSVQALIVLLLVFSCTKDNVSDIVLDKSEEISASNPYKVPEKEALASLQDFLRSTGSSPSPTKSAVSNDRLRGKRIGNIQYLRTTPSFRKAVADKREMSVRTKIHEYDEGLQLEDMIIPDTLVYVVNFDDDGFAILSADRRISASIIAVVESGSISVENFNLGEYLQQVYADSVFTYEYHNWGVDEDGDEIGWEDTLSVDFYDEQILALDTSEVYTPERMIEELVTEYLVNELLNPQQPDSSIGPGEQWDTPELDQSGNEGGGSSYGSGIITCDWITTAEVPEMLTTRWFQGKPLNKYCPIEWFGSDTAVLGCGAIAMGQILAYHEYPRNFYMDNYHVNWNMLKSIYSVGNLNPSNEQQYYFEIDLLARFLHSIAERCNTHYWNSGSWSLASKCKRVLHAAQYTGIHKYCKYREDKIITMLDDGCPVFISALEPYRLSGHSWVIDGYRIQNLVERSNGRIRNNRTLVHCNWGWRRGVYNGYYNSGVFNLRKCEEELIAPADGVLDNDRYTWWFRIITYDNPNR